MAPINCKTGPVAVTGAAGYIGAHLVKNLAKPIPPARECSLRSHILLGDNSPPDGAIVLWQRSAPDAG